MAENTRDVRNEPALMPPVDVVEDSTGITLTAGQSYIVTATGSWFYCGAPGCSAGPTFKLRVASISRFRNES